MAASKYFIAIVLPPPAMNAIEEIKEELFQRFNLRGALRSPAHITLHRPFEWKENKEEQLFAELGNFRFDKTFGLTLQDFGFFEPRVIYAAVAPSQELNELHGQLSSHCKTRLGLLNETNDMRGFHPHVTVAFRDLRKPLFYELMQEFRSRKIVAEFSYEGFSLLKLQERWIEVKTYKQS